MQLLKDTQELFRKPAAWTGSGEQKDFWKALSASRSSILMLDYDGTLAPFHQEKMKAFPYAGVGTRLEQIASLDRNRLILVTGRPVRELPLLLPVAARLEMWGSHGRERRMPDGSYKLYPLSLAQEQALAAIGAELQQAHYAPSLEWKPTSLAIHWRSLPLPEQKHLSDLSESIFHRHVDGLRLELMPFQCGVEIRAANRNKGSVVTEVIAEATNSSIIAYLGDDTTDEDAFVALKGRGISCLICPEPRESCAEFWMTPPEELLQFLDRWIEATS